MRKKICDHPYDVNDGKIVYIKDSKFMEFVDEMATQLTEERFGENTYAPSSEVGQENVMMFQEDAHDFYNERYDEVETMVNKLMGVYRWSTLPVQIFGSKDKKS